MGKHLAEELANYYSPVKNKKQFRNGLSLNKFAEEMCAKLDFQGMEPSVLSRVINGEREFTSRQLAVFCEVVEATDEEQWKLKEALHRDYGLKHGLEFDLALSPQDFEWFVALSRRIYDLRIAGTPRLAINMADELIKWVQRKQTHISSIPSVRQLSRIQADIVYEQATAYKAVTSSLGILDVIGVFYKRLCSIAKENNDDKEIYARAQILLGDTYYIKGAYCQSIQLLEEAWENKPNADYQLFLLRTLALDYAYLKEEKLFKRMEQRMRRIIARGNIVHSEYIRAVFEGIARGQSQVDPKQAFQTLEEGRRYSTMTDESNETVLINVQYLRSEAELLKRLEPTEKDLLQAKSIEGLRLAQAYKFNKYVDIFSGMLSETMVASSVGHLQATPHSN